MYECVHVCTVQLELSFNYYEMGAVTAGGRVDAGVRLHGQIGAGVGTAGQNVAVAVRLFVRVRHFGWAGWRWGDRVDVRLMVDLMMLMVLLRAVVMMVVAVVVVVVVIGAATKKDILEDGTARAGFNLVSTGPGTVRAKALKEPSVKKHFLDTSLMVSQRLARLGTGVLLALGPEQRVASQIERRNAKEEDEEEEEEEEEEKEEEHEVEEEENIEREEALAVVGGNRGVDRELRGILGIMREQNIPQITTIFLLTNTLQFFSGHPLLIAKYYTVLQTSLLISHLADDYSRNGFDN
ncbi:hypothetical protein WN51_05773 [Melipona quadrifasciata]|uniref:Uncharacterized protein n=1 Tax=Melipona quadrifasciata TaxID=166423 RepID=A0A0M9A5X3_9HYME|nr:hypothetical protein WN51_05773 [Melipona quadrifasciata]